MHKLKKIVSHNKIFKNIIQEFYLLIKELFYFIKRLIYSVYLFQKVDDKSIFVVSFYGAGYGDSAKAIIEALRSDASEYTIYWAVKGQEEARSLPDGIHPVKYGSIDFYKKMSLSKVWIDNSRKYEYPFKRKSQEYIQVWHGGLALKKIENDASDTLSNFYIRNAKRDSKITNLYLSNSNFQSDLIKESFWYNGKILEKGTPRVDQLFEKVKYKEAIKEKNNLNSYDYIVLYAPTFRNTFSLSNFIEDYDKIKTAFSQFGNVAFLVRYHPNDSRYMDMNLHEGIIDMSLYPDMNDLLVVSDALITDYSSVMFEFSYLRKPVYLLTKDYSNYVEERGFYFELDKLPFNHSNTESELIDKISQFNNEKYLENLETFYSTIGINETGDASESTADYIRNITMNGES